MTPEKDQYMRAHSLGPPLTERVPKDQCQLGHLFALLAEFQKGCLPRGRLHQVRDPLEHPPVIFRHTHFSAQLIEVRGWTARDRTSTGNGGSVAARDAIVMLLLSSRGGHGDSLGLRLGLLMLRVLGHMVIWVLLVAVPPLGRELLLVEKVLHLASVQRWMLRG
jgi:hypothetical protein